MADHLAELRSLLAGSVNFCGNYESRFGGVPAQGSECEIDQAANATFEQEWDPVPLVTCQAQADFAFLNLIDCMKALERIMVGDLLWYADLHLIRSAMEAGARGWWFHEPGLEPRDRLIRGWQERVYGLHEASTAGILPNAPRRIEQYAKACRDLGVPFKPAKGPRPPKIADGRASTLSILKDMFPSTEDDGTPLGPVLYRYTSSIVHSTGIGLVSRLEAGDQMPGVEHTYIAAAQSRSLADIWGMTSAALWTFVTVFDRRLDYHGWQGDEWVSWKRTIRDKHRLRVMGDR